MFEHSAAISTFRWSLPAGPVTATIVAALLFAQAFVRLRQRGRADHAPWSRAALFAAGLGLSLLPLVSPIDPVGDSYLLSVHMIEHVLIADAGPALMILAIRGPLAVFLLPPFLLVPIVRQRWVPATIHVLLRPAVTVLVWSAVMWTWHVPAIYDYTLTHPAVHDLEHLSFALVGVLVWTQLIDPTRSQRMTIPQRLIFALAIVVSGQILSDLLIFSHQAYYASYANQPVRVLGLSPLTDQRIAGLVMMFEQTITMATCAVILVRQLGIDQPRHTELQI